MIPALVTACALAAGADPFGFVTDTNTVKSEAIADLIDDLGGDPKKGRAAAMRLVRFGRNAVPALATALRSDSLQVRFYAASALDLIRHASSTEALFGVLSSDAEDPLVRRVAARAMGRDEYVRAVPVLIRLLVGETAAAKPATPARTPTAASEPPPPSDVPRYLATSPLAGDEEFRFEVVRSLAYIGDAGAIGVLVDALKDPSSRIREVAAQGLGDQRAPLGIPGLRALLADSDAVVAASAGRALAKYGNAAATATPDLIEALAQTDVRVQRAARGALAVITGYSFSTQTRWREWWQKQLEKKDEPKLPDVESDAPHQTFDEQKQTTPRSNPEPGGTSPALRPPWQWDDEDWRTTPE